MRGRQICSFDWRLPSRACSGSVRLSSEAGGRDAFLGTFRRHGERADAGHGPDSESFSTCCSTAVALCSMQGFLPCACPEVRHAP